MTSIIGYADTLYQKTLSPEEVHQLAGIIMNEGMRLEALSFKLMELVTLSQSNFQLEEARIDEVIADAVETIQPTAEKEMFGCSFRQNQPGYVWNMISLRHFY